MYIYIYVDVYVLVFDLFLSPYWFYEYVLKPEIPPTTGRASNSSFKYTFISYPLSTKIENPMFLICLGQ